MCLSIYFLFRILYPRGHGPSSTIENGEIKNRLYKTSREDPRVYGSRAEITRLAAAQSVYNNTFYIRATATHVNQNVSSPPLGETKRINVVVVVVVVGQHLHR